MDIRDKLKIIQSASGLTQTGMAAKLGVSFVALNNWWTGKAKPRKKHAEAIDAMYREYTGQKIIPKTVLAAKKELIGKESHQHKNIFNVIAKNPDIRDQFMLSLTYNSNKIEGSTLSEDETADIMFNNRTIPDKSLVEQLENIKKIDEALVLKLHSILMNGIRDDAGIYRRHGVRIVGSNVPTANYLKITKLMESLFVDLNKKPKDIISHASDIHARFEQIHPFSDGNGRIGRLILVAMFLKSNIAPAVIKQENKR